MLVVRFADREKIAGCDAKDFGDIKEALEQQAPATVLNLDQDVPRYSRLERKCFLGKALFDAQRSDSSADLLAMRCPGFEANWVDLGGAGRHASSTQLRCKNVCPTSSTLAVVEKMSCRLITYTRSLLA